MLKMRTKQKLGYIVCITCCLWVAGCAAPAPPTTSAPEVPPAPTEPVRSTLDQSDLTYFVKPGDTLTKIATETTGDPENWRQIAQYNRIANPTVLQIGQALIIPSLMLAAPPVPVSTPVIDTAPPPASPPAAATDASVPQPAADVALVPAIAEEPVQATGWIIIKGSYYPREIKTAPELGADTLLLAWPGTRLQYFERPDGWYKVLTQKGEGYVHPSHAQEE